MLSKNHYFLDVHAIQTLPPSNINRDDTGSPKTAQYGGVRRARVSSQSWKKAMRDYFRENSENASVGVRSLNIVEYIANKVIHLNNSYSIDEALEMTDKTLNKAGIKTKDKKAKALFFLGEKQANDLAQAIVDGIEDKKELQNILKSNPDIDIALFGRMVADDPSLNEDASSQVAHSISTHAVETEFDFFTAVDDLAPEDNAGAGMLGTIEYNSSTLYRYANVAIHELLRQLDNKEMVVDTLKLFIEAFALSLPTGKVTTFANQTIPQALLVTVRSDRPVSLVSAFEEPVKSSEGFVEKSIEKLFDEYNKTQKFVKEPEFSLYLTLDDYELEDKSLVKTEDFTNLIDEFGNKLTGLVD